MTLDVPIDFSESESISIKTWSPKADIPVRLKLEGSAGEVLELDVNTTVENQWETLTWDFTGQTGEVEWLTVVLFFEFVVDLPGDGSTYYYDDIQVADIPLNNNDDLFSTVVSYPNPVINTWNIQGQETITSIEIFNLLGQKVLSINPNTPNVELNLSNLQSNIYIARLNIGNQTKTIRIIKK